MRALVLSVALSFATGCLYTRYLAQGAAGQLDLLSRAKPIEEVIRDPDTPLRVAMLLAEIPAIKAYGKSYGLVMHHNYETYARIYPRAGAVWFVGAADPVAFKPVPWCFPVVGCFPGLGWFDEDDAIFFKQQLEAKGYDVNLRPAAAYSTGGWFPDPVLSTMFAGGDSALPALANVILHESVHATILIPDQSFFNESLASYIADVLVDHWIETRFGAGSPEDLAWTVGTPFGLARSVRQATAYRDLKAVYESKKPRAQKLAEKAKIIGELVADLHLHSRPNNATLTESRVYNGGTAALRAAHQACGDIALFIRAAKTLKREDFTKPLQDDLDPIGKKIAERCQRGSSTRT
jgi:predicted aminopeptidase